LLSVACTSLLWSRATDSLRRHYPDQVLAVGDAIAALSARGWRAPVRTDATRSRLDSTPDGDNRGDADSRTTDPLSLATPEGAGPLRRERLRTARLYFVCEAAPRGEDPEPLLRAALTGGVDIVQLRDKNATRRTLEIAGQTFRRLCNTYSALFTVNDDPSLAHACDADGVHVGQEDIAVSEAREVLGPDAIIGLSTHSEQQIAAAEGVDYISVGPVWETPTKEGRPAVGLELVRHAAEHSRFPFYAVGGIDAARAPSVIEAGASRLCVVRAIRDAADPGAVAAELRRAFVGREIAPGG
jgi:thiamine-phosphate pyrophosphorylase